MQLMREAASDAGGNDPASADARQRVAAALNGLFHDTRNIASQHDADTIEKMRAMIAAARAGATSSGATDANVAEQISRLDGVVEQAEGLIAAMQAAGASGACSSASSANTRTSPSSFRPAGRLSAPLSSAAPPRARNGANPTATSSSDSRSDSRGPPSTRPTARTERRRECPCRIAAGRRTTHGTSGRFRWPERQLRPTLDATGRR